ncbi:BQ5605_C011g06594 [Microbotryum silenes-dioicae]|uniref:BQ5605_C011g06594 protein n=1 Tax=Microbotryum silenes-dioicae TaxID=796604 RepID=A0A2X0NLS7_9BASI|nr:BQ5605_C011g06594 [Microbotryum silenes-dioicae]
MAETAKRTIAHHEEVTQDALHTNDVKAPAPQEPVAISQKFLDQIQAAITAKDIDAIVDCFMDDNQGYWRDILCIDQTDFNALQTNDIVSDMLVLGGPWVWRRREEGGGDFSPPFLRRQFRSIRVDEAGHLNKFGVPAIENLKVTKPQSACIVPASAEMVWAQAFITFETDDIRGKGMVRLRESKVGRGDWKAFVFFTSVDEVKGHEEFGGSRRPLGAEHGEKSDPKVNWRDRRKVSLEYKDGDPTVIIVGGGQNGLMLAARLRMLGINHLVIEKHGRVGDSWRKRYHSLCLHDPVHGDHLPYIPFPPGFPKFIPKDKIANWFESYAESMELNIWLNSTVERGAKFDPQTQKWEVTVLRNNGAEKRVFHVNHLVLASGFSGEPRLPSFPREDMRARSVGCCNSGHDIAADLVENGADTTIVQRSWTYVMSSEHGLHELLKGVYEENGPPLDEADIILTSLPTNVLAQFQTEATKEVTRKDKDLLDGLRKAGFKLNPYPEGLFVKYFRDGGGYYIDVGASKMIADGKIKIKQGVEIKKLTKDGVLFEDGTELKADVVVMATGYTSQRETIRKVISDEVADGLGPCWGKDAQGEIPGCWRNSGVPRFYLQSGNMFQARCYSKWLALQIHMCELGLTPKQAEYPKYKEVVDPRF